MLNTSMKNYELSGKLEIKITLVCKNFPNLESTK